MTEVTWGADDMVRVAAPVREQVTQVLRQAILTSQLAPGQRLVERELIDRLGVSRTTIREAIRELTTEGLVTVVPQRGAVVATVTPNEAADLYAARSAIESLMIQRFIERATDTQAQELWDQLKHYRRAIEEAAPISDMLNAKDLFYDKLTEGADSSVLSNLLTSLHARISLLRVKSLSKPGRPMLSIEELEEIVKAIQARDVTKAKRLSVKHIQNAADAALQEN
jgi:DNA-binding GntR family transcriptional regulator